MAQLSLAITLLAALALLASANKEAHHCADQLITFMDEKVHEYLSHHKLPSTTLAHRATFYDGTVRESETALRLDPTRVYSKGNHIFVETRVKIPLFRASYKCKYQAIWEYPCPDIEIITKNAIAIGVISFSAVDKIVHFEDMELISADNDIQVSSSWLKPLLEQFTDERLKSRFGVTYKNIVNGAKLVLPEHIAKSCREATESNDISQVLFNLVQ